jgi:C-terminal processing protease CtpA/Prc
VQAAFSKIKNIDDLVNEHYIGAIDSESLANAIAKGYIVGLGDAHAAYYSKEEYRAYQAQITGQYEGIGATSRLPDIQLAACLISLIGLE